MTDFVIYPKPPQKDGVPEGIPWTKGLSREDLELAVNRLKRENLILEGKLQKLQGSKTKKELPPQTLISP